MGCDDDLNRDSWEDVSVAPQKHSAGCAATIGKPSGVCDCGARNCAVKIPPAWHIQWAPVNGASLEAQQMARVNKPADALKMRQFPSGATRNAEEGKLDFEGFLSPEVLEMFAVYMDRNRVQADGQVRASDNWQKGIPMDTYMSSGWRHFHEWWTLHRQGKREGPLDHIGVEQQITALCALLFNVQGYLFELRRQSRAGVYQVGQP